MTNEDTNASDLTRLVQHVELNESGWWEQAVERLLLACAYTLGPSSYDDLVAMVVESCGIQPRSARVDSAIQRLVESGDLIEGDRTLRVSEETHENFQLQESQTLDSEERVRTRFGNMARERGLSDRADELWGVLEIEVVLPVVRHMGARMYGLLTANRSDGNSDLESQMRDFLARHSDQIRAFLVDFIDPRDSDVRRFVLHRLNAQYALDAAALPDDALDRLSLLDHRAERVDVFLDTNFLFSVLGLHENPGDDVANELLRLVRDLEGRVDLRLYVLPETVNETRKVLQDVMFRLKDFRGQSNLAEAARRTTSFGLASRYLEAASAAAHALTAEQFFGPYESDLVTVLRNKGVELYNADLSHLHTDQNVIDDIHDESELQEKLRSRGPKSYEANLHDMVLWHFTRSRRSPAVDSPLETTAWVATLDNGFINFDRQKRTSGSGPPVCLEPSSLIQLFQFWIPSSTNLDEALVGSVRQPLLFLTFDKQSEQVTLRILSEISRFEGIGDLDADTASAILTSTALRNRLIASENDRSNDQELVQEEVVKVAQRLGEEAINLRNERTESHEINVDLKNQLITAERTAEAQQAEQKVAERTLAKEKHRRRHVEEQNRKLSGTTTGLDARVVELEKTNQKLTQRMERVDHEILRKRGNRRFIGLSFATCVLSLSVLLLTGELLDTWTNRRAFSWLAGTASCLLILLNGLKLAARGTTHEDSKLIARVSQLLSLWWAFLLAVAASVIADLLL